MLSTEYILTTVDTCRHMYSICSETVLSLLIKLALVCVGRQVNHWILSTEVDKDIHACTCTCILNAME